MVRRGLREGKRILFLAVGLNFARGLRGLAKLPSPRAEDERAGIDYLRW
jgi:hypothetical protein